MCMGRHVLPFTIKPDFDWKKLDNERQSDGKSDEVLENTATSSQWMLPTTTWEHAEDVAVYTGTARSAQVKVSYILECTSLCAVRGSSSQVVATKEVKILGSIDPSSLHLPKLVGSYAPSGADDHKISFAAKLNRRTYHQHENISIHYLIANNFSSPIKEVKFSLHNSALIREPSEPFPTLHTACIASVSHSKAIQPSNSVDMSLQIPVPASIISRWTTVTQTGTKIRFEPILRVALVLENFQDHIFQTALSISAPPRALHPDAEEIGRLDSFTATLVNGVVPPTSRTSAPAQLQQPPSGAKRIVWVKDSEGAPCAHCHGLLTFLNLKHHCRGCGLLVCSTHSKSIPAPNLFGIRPRRVCNACEPRVLSGELCSGFDDRALGESLPIVRLGSELTASTHQELDSDSSGLENVDLGSTSIPVKQVQQREEKAHRSSYDSKPNSSSPSSSRPNVASTSV